MAEVAGSPLSLPARLARYSCAAGAGVMASSTMAGVLQDPWPLPVEGLPIAIESDVLIGNPLLIDIDGNGEDDFKFFYSTEYGGGFSVQYVQPVSAVGSPRVQYHWQYLDSTGTSVAARNDLTEFIPVWNTYSSGNIFSNFTQSEVFLDRNAAGALPAYTPFRANTGFIGLALGTADYSKFTPATLKITISPNGLRLLIHSGWYRTDGFDLYLDDGILQSDGFEDYPPSPYFPEDALSALAAGDTGESHD